VLYTLAYWLQYNLNQHALYFIQPRLFYTISLSITQIFHTISLSITRRFEVEMEIIFVSVCLHSVFTFWKFETRINLVYYLKRFGNRWKTVSNIYESQKGICKIHSVLGTYSKLILIHKSWNCKFCKIIMSKIIVSLWLSNSLVRCFVVNLYWMGIERAVVFVLDGL